MSSRLEEFRSFREKMNERILEEKHLPINRFFTLDTKAYEPGATNEQLFEVFNVALVVGGLIVIPHLRRAVALLDELDAEAS